MQETDGMSENDMELVNALQLAPRASWSELSVILGQHATTLARRWERITNAGMARISIAPGPGMAALMELAFIELTCRNSQVTQVADDLFQDHRTMTIQFIAGSAHLLVTVAAPGQSLADFLLTTIGSLDGVLHYSVRTVTGQLVEASNWHFRALPPATMRKLRRLVNPPESHGGETHVAMDEIDQEIVRSLSINGRMGFREIAQRAGITPPAAARRVNRLIGGNYIMVRCDIVRQGLGQNVSAVFWGSMSPEDILLVGPNLAAELPEIRIMTAVTGANNIHMVVWLNSPWDSLAVERKILHAIPGLTIDDRRIVLRTFKYNGARITESGRFGDVLPVGF